MRFPILFSFLPSFKNFYCSINAAKAKTLARRGSLWRTILPRILLFPSLLSIFHGDSAIFKPGKPISNQVYYNVVCYCDGGNLNSRVERECYNFLL